MTKKGLYAPIKEKYHNLKNALESRDLQHIIELTLEVHAMVHPRLASGLDEKTISDYVLDYMLQNDKEMLVPRMNCEISLDWAGTDMVPMCWQFWHTYRIEDLVSNFLIANQNQIFDEEWQKRMHSPITDTGNALESTEIISFGKALNGKALYEYIVEVSRNTRKIIASLTIDQLQQKPLKEQLDCIMNVGGLTSDKRSVWLLDYWGGLTVSEMILTPLTDHHMMHLPPCLDQILEK